jgi:hypothetical protein
MVTFGTEPTVVTSGTGILIVGHQSLGEASERGE